MSRSYADGTKESWMLMLLFSHYSNNKSYLEQLKRLNGRWFNRHNNVYAEGKIFGIGMAWILPLHEIDAVENAENNAFKLFRLSGLRLFIMRHKYLMEISNPNNYMRFMKEDTDHLNMNYSYKEYEQGYRYTILTPENNGETIQPISHWGEFLNISDARATTMEILDNCLSNNYNLNNLKASNLMRIMEVYRT